MTQTTQDQAITAMSFEDAMAALEALVRGLESGQGKLEDAIAAYERGALLKQHCDALLRAAQARIEKITASEDGAVDSIPF